MLPLFHIYKSKQRICQKRGFVEFSTDMREHLRPGKKEHKIIGCSLDRGTQT